MKALHKNILKRLDLIINDTGKHIHNFIDNPHAFTRKRSLDAAKKNDKVVSTSLRSTQKSTFAYLF